MNAGTFAMVAYLMMVMLISTGWWDRTVRSLSIRRRTLITWLTVFAILTHLDLIIVPKIVINSGLLFVVIMAVYSWRMVKPHRRALLFSAVTLTGAICYVVRELAIVDPALLLLPALWLQAMSVLLLGGIAITGIWERMTLLCGGLTLGYLLFIWRHFHQFTAWMIGEPSFSDLFWISLFGLILIDSIERGMIGSDQRVELVDTSHDPS